MSLTFVAEKAVMKLPHYAPLIALTRGGHLESVHFGLLAVVDARGRVLLSRGDPEVKVYTRSSLKPLQALPLILTGAYEMFGLTPRELAVAAASHSGEPEHIETVRGMLARGGLSEELLVCGPQWPISLSATLELARLGQQETPPPIYNNCSGKHAGMLLVCKQMGWPLEGYHLPEHPLQQTIQGLIEELLGVGKEELVIGVDGCGLANYALPLSSIGRLFALLAEALASGEEKPPMAGEVRDEVWSALCQVAGAMTAHPEMVGGKEGRFDTAFMEAMKGRGIAKTGAEGLQGVGVVVPEEAKEQVAEWLWEHQRREKPAAIEVEVGGISAALEEQLSLVRLDGEARGVGVVVKVADGDQRRRARYFTALDLMVRAGLVAEETVNGHPGLSKFYDRRVLNTRSWEVGEVVSLWMEDKKFMG